MKTRAVLTLVVVVLSGAVAGTVNAWGECAVGTGSVNAGVQDGLRRVTGEAGPEHGPVAVTVSAGAGYEYRACGGGSSAQSQNEVTVSPGTGPTHRWGSELEWGELKTRRHSSAGMNGLEKARQALESRAARRVLRHCRRLGIQELPEEAFTVRKSGRGQGADLVVVPMKNPGGDRFASALLFRENDATAMAITVDTSTGELVQAISPDGEEELLSIDKKKWVDCLTVSCSVCIVSCAFTGPLWLKCMGACCGVAAGVCLAISMNE